MTAVPGLPAISADYESRAMSAAQLRPAKFSIATTGFFAHHFPDEPTLVRRLKPNAKGEVKDNTLFFTAKDFVTEKPGTFLTKFFADKLKAEEIASQANAFRIAGTPAKLEFATTPEAAYECYMRGPASCVSKNLSHFLGEVYFTKDMGNIHPSHVYASCDLAVAYIRRHSDNRITARTVVWPERKIHSKVYGDAQTILFALRCAGYQPSKQTHECGFFGARIRAIPIPGFSVFIPGRPSGPLYVTPYADEVARLNEVYDDSGALWLQMVADNNSWQGVHSMRNSFSSPNYVQREPTARDSIAPPKK